MARARVRLLLRRASSLPPRCVALQRQHGPQAIGRPPAYHPLSSQLQRLLRQRDSPVRRWLSCFSPRSRRCSFVRSCAMLSRCRCQRIGRSVNCSCTARFPISPLAPAAASLRACVRNNIAHSPWRSKRLHRLRRRTDTRCTRKGMCRTWPLRRSHASIICRLSSAHRLRQHLLRRRCTPSRFFSQDRATRDSKALFARSNTSPRAACGRGRGAHTIDLDALHL